MVRGSVPSLTIRHVTLPTCRGCVFFQQLVTHATHCRSLSFQSMSMFGEFLAQCQFLLYSYIYNTLSILPCFFFKPLQMEPDFCCISFPGRGSTFHQPHLKHTDLLRVRGRTKKRGATTLDCAFDAGKVNVHQMKGAGS